MPAVIRTNGTTLDAANAMVAALDHGLLYGNGLFETMRAANGIPFAFQAHLDRLETSAATIGLPLPPQEALRAEVAQALEDAGHADAYVRLTVTRGPGGPAPDPQSCGPPTIMTTVKSFPPPPQSWLTHGIRAITSTIRRNAQSPLPRVKSLNYMECILAKQAAKQAGADEAIFLDTEGRLAEATAWNVFFAPGHSLHTPDESGPLLPGVTRAIVLQLALDAGITAYEGTHDHAELAEADEAFLTNSLYGVVPLGALDGSPIGGKAPGPITRRLAAAYEDLRRRECGLGNPD